jgi:TolB-like protein
LADIFVSYKREDAAKVRKLVAALRGVGLDTWWDEDIPGGAQWEAAIEKALADAKAVIVCWSAASVASENVRSEARVAREDGRLVQVFLKPCTPPLFFGERQGIDLSKWRGDAGDPRIVKLAANARRIACGEPVESGERRKVRRWLEYRIHAAVAVLLLLAGSFAGWWLLSPAKAAGPQTLAVLPFRALNPADANLVDAIWDDTRGAISRNPNLRVLGRQSVEALADKHLEPADYRRKVGAEYLLDGSVQHVGDQVQMKLSLVRTEDGTEVWSDQFGGKLDDVFAFQQRVSNEVEGRIRGRLAPGGGAVAKNIATSAEVYALYAEARAKLLQRRGPSHQEAVALLKKAVAIDPNYAPGWADLAQAVWLRGDGTAEQVRAEAEADVRRALTLAPNLAHAYAVRALIHSTAPETEPDLRKAVALDPNEVEGWMWLGNCLSGQNRTKAALAAHSRAVEIEPLWFNSMFNKMDDLARLNDRRGLFAELHRAESMGDPYLALRAREHAAFLTGQIAATAQAEFEIQRLFPDKARKLDIAETLLKLGFVDETRKFLNMPESEVAPYKGMPLSAPELHKRYADPVQFWQADDAPYVYGRLLPKQGRLAEYVGYYKRAFRNADGFYSAVAWADWGQFADLAPNVAANLRAAGENALAQQIIDKDEATIAPLLRNGPANRELGWRLAQLRAVEGRDDEAMTALRRVIDQDWLPDGIYFASDIAEQPCFARLRTRADFQAIRMQILNHLEQQRRQITPRMLAAAGLV